MIGTFAFLLLWVLVGLGLFLTAVRGGPRRGRRGSRAANGSSRRGALLVFSIIFGLLGIIVPALVLAGSSTKHQSDRQTFANSCGICHTMAAAGTTGTVGPNLDGLLPTTSRVQNALRIGGTNDGRMPAGLLSGAQADAMARYVSAVAGKRTQ